MPPVARLQIDMAELIKDSGLSIAEIARRAGVSYWSVYGLAQFPDRDNQSLTVLGSVLYVLGEKVSNPFVLERTGEAHVTTE